MSLKHEGTSDTGKNTTDAEPGQSWRNPGDFPAFGQHRTTKPEHRRRTRTERMQRFTDLVGKTTVPESKDLEGQEKLDSILEHATPEGVMRFLQHINGQLRNDRPTRGSEIVGQKESNSRMLVSEGSIYGAIGEAALVAPESDLQQELFTEYLDAIKVAKGRDKKAALAFYAINNLHLFKDGNGRTSRVIYQMIKAGDISDMSDDYVEHNDYYSTTEGVGREDFLKINQLPSPGRVNQAANEFLQEELCDSGLLDMRLRDKGIYVNSYDSDNESGLVKIAMKRGNRAELSETEQTALGFALSDGNTIGRTTISGLSLISVLHQKGKTAEIATALGSKKQLGIDINFDNFEPSREQREGVMQTFAEWEPDDYRQTIATYRSLKKRQNEMIMRFFTEDMKFDDGFSVSDWASGHQS